MEEIHVSSLSQMKEEVLLFCRKCKTLSTTKSCLEHGREVRKRDCRISLIHDLNDLKMKWQNLKISKFIYLRNVIKL